MKKVTLTLLFALSLAAVALAQAPQGFKYQAVARHTDNEPYSNTPVRIRLSISQNSGTTDAVYIETHNVTTSDLGVFNLNVGRGAAELGNFNTIDWGSAAHYLKVELSTNDGIKYIPMGTSQLLSVPYALYANQAGTGGNGRDGDNSPTNELQTLSLNDNQLSISNGNTVTLPILSAYAAGTGISIQGNQIANTGDTIALDDITTTSVADGDLTGTFSNLTIKPSRVGTLQLSNNSITTEKLTNLGATTPGQVLQWSGTQWQAGTSGNSGQWTNGTENSLYRINGKVGIGTDTPRTTLHIANDTAASLWLEGKEQSAISFGKYEAENQAFLGLFNESFETQSTVPLAFYKFGFIPPTDTTEERFDVTGAIQINDQQVNLIGKVGIGTLEPSSLLHLNGDSYPATIHLTNSESGLTLDDGAAIALERDNLRIRTLENGSLQLTAGGTSGTSTVELSGRGFFASIGDNSMDLGRSNARWKAVWAVRGTIQTSDLRLKKNIQNIGYGLETVLKMRPVRYEWKKDQDAPQTNLGFIAQEMAQIVPEVVVLEGDAYGMKYADLIPVLTKAIQEQQAEIEMLKGQVAQFQSENKVTQQDNSALKSKVEQMEASLQRIEMVLAKGN